MKPALVLLTLTLLFSLSLQAKQPELPDLAQISEKLQLDNETAARLEELVQQHHAQMQARHKEMGQQRKQQRSDRHEMRMQHREELLTVLSHEQLYQFENYMHELRGQQRQKHGAADPAGQGE